MQPMFRRLLPPSNTEVMTGEAFAPFGYAPNGRPLSCAPAYAAVARENFVGRRLGKSVPLVAVPDAMVAQAPRSGAIATASTIACCWSIRDPPGRGRYGTPSVTDQDFDHLRHRLLLRRRRLIRPLVDRYVLRTSGETFDRRKAQQILQPLAVLIARRLPSFEPCRPCQIR
jgi:hypothetical protein